MDPVEDSRSESAIPAIVGRKPKRPSKPKKRRKRNTTALDRAQIIADRAAGKSLEDTCTHLSISRRGIQRIMQQAREDDVEAYQRFCGAARWAAVTCITAAIEDIASGFAPEVIERIKSPVDRAKVLAHLARARRDLVDSGAAPGAPGAPPAPGSPTNIQINLMTDADWNARQASRYPDAPAAALPK